MSFSRLIFFSTKHYPVILQLFIVSLTLKILCYSPAVSSTEEHSSETQVLQISTGHGYLAPSHALFLCWKPPAMAPSPCSEICHQKAPWGHCLLRYRDFFWSFQLSPHSFELIIAKGNYTFWQVLQAVEVLVRTLTEDSLILMKGPRVL